MIGVYVYIYILYIYIYIYIYIFISTYGGYPKYELWLMVSKYMGPLVVASLAQVSDSAASPAGRQRALLSVVGIRAEELSLEILVDRLPSGSNIILFCGIPRICSYRLAL